MESEERMTEMNAKVFQTLIEKNADMMTLALPEGKLLYASPSLTHTLGFTFEEYRDNPAFDFIHPEDVPGLVEGIMGIVGIPGKSFFRQQRLLHKDGTYRWCEGTITNMLHDPDLGALVSNFRDITERKNAENALRKAETNYREIFDKAHDAIYVHEIETGKVLEVNEKATEITGFSKEELLNGNPEEFITDHPDYSFQKAIAYIQQAAAGIPQTFEWLGKRKDGSYNWFEVNLKKASIAGEDRILAFFREINARKIAEERIQRLNEELESKVLERTAQLETANMELEAFSYSVSHDLRAPLRAIGGYAQMLKEDYNATLDQEGNRILDVIKYNAGKMGALIDDLLAFSRLGRKELQKTSIDMNELVEGILKEISESSPHAAVIHLRKLPMVNADSSLLHQVLVNLISNAIKYSSQKRNPIVDIFSEEKVDEFVFCVKDNGIGFDMQYVHKLFGVFQRLHSQEEFEGTGVGLAIVQKVVSRHGGRVWAKAKLDEGAAFYFSIPKSKAK